MLVELIVLRVSDVVEPVIVVEDAREDSEGEEALRPDIFDVGYIE